MQVGTRLVAGVVLALAASVATAQVGPRNRAPLPDAPDAASPVDDRSLDERTRDMTAAATARTVPELNLGIANACRLSSWQFALREVRTAIVRLDASPTMSDRQRACATAVINSSKFHLAPS